MSKTRLWPIVGAGAALALCACSHRPALKSSQQMPIPIMPLAAGHIPPLASSEPQQPNDAYIPMRVAGVYRSGRVVHVAWDAPGATQAVISFSADGSAFQTVGRTDEPLAQFAPATPHGTIRIFVTDGKRRNTVDYRI